MTENFIKSEGDDMKGLINRFKKRNFTGDTGQAIKNSSYQLTTNIVMKVGSLIFTIIIARMLLPDLFGLYSLALSTIVLFGAFSDLGLGSALIAFVSKSLSRGDKEKAKSYYKKIFKWKLWLLGATSILLLASAYFIANYYYSKPIFLALVVGAIYNLLVGLEGFFENLFQSGNNFKFPNRKEIIFQIARLILVPLAIFLILKTNASQDITTATILLSVSLAYLIGVVYLRIVSKRKLAFLSAKSKELGSEEVRNLKKFIYPLIATLLSGVFFGYIDTIMLGHYVTSDFISYYSAAFNIISSVSGIIGFTALALFPIFSRLEGKKLERIFAKARNFTILISLGAGILTYFLSTLAIKIAYGDAYLTSVVILEFFSVLVLILPLLGLYNNYLISRKKTGIIAKLLIATTLLNIVLNFFFITYGLQFSQLDAVLGACFATIISRFAYFASLFIVRRQDRKELINKKD